MKLKDVDAWMAENKKAVLERWFKDKPPFWFKHLSDDEITDTLAEYLRDTYFTLGYYAAKVDEQQDKS